MRTRIGPRASPFCAAAAAPSASGAVRNATKKASPCVSTSTPLCAPNASRRMRRCSASAFAYSAVPSSWSSFVEPSTSVKRKVTVPDGRLRRTDVIMPARARLSIATRRVLGRPLEYADVGALNGTSSISIASPADRPLHPVHRGPQNLHRGFDSRRRLGFEQSARIRGPRQRSARQRSAVCVTSEWRGMQRRS